MNVGVIGIGKFGENHVRILTQLGHNVYVDDTDLDRMKQIKEKYHVEKLKEQEVEAVFVATSSDTHYEVVKRWIEANVNVFCEKPLCFKSYDVRKLVRLAYKHNVILASGHVFRFTDGAEVLRQLYYIVNPYRIVMQFINTNPPRSDSNVFYNLAIHYLDLLEYLGLCRGKVRGYYMTDLEGIINIKYHKVEVIIDVRCGAQLKKRTVELIANGVTLNADLMVNSTEPLKVEIMHFLECIRTNTYPVNYADEHVIQVLEKLV